MKQIIALFLILMPILANSYPIGVQGLSQSSATYPPIIKAPYNQTTAVTGGTLLETDSENILINPSFQASSVSSGWTIGSMTVSPETSSVNLFTGKQAISI